MHTIQSAVPEPRLSPFLRCFAQREISPGGVPLLESTMASLEHVVSFCLSGQAAVHRASGGIVDFPPVHYFGTQTRAPGHFSFTGPILSFGIFLKPFASWELFRIPPSEFADGIFEAREVLGPWVTSLWDKLASGKDFTDRVRLATETMLPFAENAAQRTTAMCAAQNLLRHRSGLRIEELARDACLTVRSFERKFAREIGLSPKLFSRVGRFQAALDRKRTSGDRWLDVAHELGYFDQMHMVKEFRELGGEAPSRLLRNCGDYQPWSIGAPMKKTTLV